MARRRVIVVGGGAIGCALAWRLARRGDDVRLFERGPLVGESSDAAAGILGAQVEMHTPGPLAELCRESLARYPRFVDALEQDSGVSVGFVRSGVLRVCGSALDAEHLRAQVAWQRERGLPAEFLGADEVARLEPLLSAPASGAAHFVGDCRVHARRLAKALVEAARRAGATLTEQAPVEEVLPERRAVRVRGEVMEADVVVVCAGAWSSLLRGAGLPDGTMRPVRGQMLLLTGVGALPRRVVFTPQGYLVPREGEGIVVGSTMEEVGFEKAVTAAASHRLLGMAQATMPSLAGARVQEIWSGLRPASRDALPLLGETESPGVFVATGHFRNGVLLAPVTSDVMAGLVAGEGAGVDVEPFSPRRFA